MTRSGVSRFDRFPNFLAARHFDHALVGSDEGGAHLVAYPLRVGRHEDRRTHRGHASSFASRSPMSTFPTSWSASKS